jgi:sulfatase maturation enzyme AslB (radical SAM superfamily)
MLKSTNCQAAYHGICINQDGTIDPCCQYSPKPGNRRYRYTEFEEYLEDIPTKMHNDGVANVEHPGCKKCYREEQHGWQSLRQLQNLWYAPFEEGQVSAKNLIYDVELRLGNFCNLKCIMCAPRQSSSIAAEQHAYKNKFEKIFGPLFSTEMPYYWKEEEFKQFAQTILTKNARRVNITGGEPFIIPEVVKFLDMLTPRANNLALSFNTNLTEVSDKLLVALRKFKRINIMISLEGVGAMNDYVRYPSRWADINNNIELLKKELPQSRLEINHVLQHTSTYSLPDLMYFAKQQNLDVKITTVSGHPYLTLDSVPSEHLCAFRSWAEQSVSIDDNQRSLITGMINSAKFDSELYHQFKEYVNLLDSIRNVDYFTAFPQAKI